MYCTVFALFYFVFEGNFQEKAPGALYSVGRFNGGLLCYEFERILFRGAYAWRDLGPVQTSNFSCAELNTYLGRSK